MAKIIKQQQKVEMTAEKASTHACSEVQDALDHGVQVCRHLLSPQGAKEAGTAMELH